MVKYLIDANQTIYKCSGEVRFLDKEKVSISVRNLVEFILRSGDITTSDSGLADPDAMQEGTRIHKKLQKKMA